MAYYPQNIISPYFSPEKDAELVRLYREDPRLYIEEFLYIKDKRSGGIVKFKLNEAQLIVYEVIQELRRKGVPIRLIILKARQMGISTLIQALLFARTVLYPQSTSLIVAHDKGTSQKLYEMTQLFYDRLPTIIKPMRSHRTTTGIRFENPKETQRLKYPGLRSEIRIATARNADVGAGFTPTGIHCSEIARWPTAEETMLSLMQGVPSVPDTMVSIESTAKGAEGYFYDDWLEVSSGSKKEWTPIFLPWWILEEYEVALEEGEEEYYQGSNLDTEERELLKMFPDAITAPKLKWRRRTLAEKCQNSVLKFHQEYPSYALEAFLAQGESIFDLESIEWYWRNQKRDGIRGELQADRRGNPFFVPNENGPLTVYKFPHEFPKTEEFVVGADSAMGSRQEAQKADSNKTKRDTDNNVAEVFSAHREQAAEFTSNNIDPFDFAEYLMLIGKWYNWGLIYPEAGGDGGGYGVAYRLKEASYPKIGRWKRWDAINNEELTKAVGWEPNFKSQPIALGKLMRELRRGAGKLDSETEGVTDKHWPRMRLYSAELLRELGTFVLDKKSGKTGGRAGTHDDRVIAVAMALLGLEQIAVPNDAQPARPAKELSDLYDRHGRRLRDDPSGFYPSWYLS